MVVGSYERDRPREYRRFRALLRGLRGATSAAERAAFREAIDGLPCYPWPESEDRWRLRDGVPVHRPEVPVRSAAQRAHDARLADPEWRRAHPGGRRRGG